MRAPRLTLFKTRPHDSERRHQLVMMRHGGNNPYHRYRKTAFLFIAPQVLVTLIFFIWPSVSAIRQSLYVGDAFGLHERFVGFLNFIALWHDQAYGAAVVATLMTTIPIAVLTLGLGLALAVLVSGRSKSQSLYQSFLLWPYAVAPAVAAMLWRLLCHPTLGWVTIGLSYVGYEFNYLIHPKQALWMVILTASWQQFSYNFLFYFAALQLIPSALKEAATLDGASTWRQFWDIIFPLLSSTTFFLLIMNVMYAFFDTFGIIHVLTHGGPGTSTTTLIYKVYQDGFVGMDPGSSSAQSVMLMVIVIGLTMLQFRYLEHRIHYK